MHSLAPLHQHQYSTGLLATTDSAGELVIVHTWFYQPYPDTCFAKAEDDD